MYLSSKKDILNQRQKNVKFTNKSLRRAVGEWLTDSSKAEENYWDMSQLFNKATIFIRMG